MKKPHPGKTPEIYYTAKTGWVQRNAAHPLSVTGRGNRGAEAFGAHPQAFHSLTYRITFTCKALKKNFTLAKLEGLWWFNEQKRGTTFPVRHMPQNLPRSEWEYRLLIRRPGYVVQEHMREALLGAMAEKPCPQAVELYHTPQETSVQILYTGPFHTEPVPPQEGCTYLAEHYLRKAGHHEMYPMDFRNALAQKLRSILRQPPAGV